MTPILSWLLLLASQVTAIDLEVYDTSSVHGSLDNVETFVQEESQVVNSLIELDIQLDHVLDHVASSSGSTDIDVVIEVPEDFGNGSGIETLDEIVVVVPAGAKLSDEEKGEIQHEMETEVAETLDARIVETAMQSSEEEEGGAKVLDKVTRLFEDEAEQELQQMEGQLKTVLDNLSSSEDTEIDIVVTESDDDKQQEQVAKEFVVVVPAGSGHRLTEQEKEQLEDEIVDEAADALGEVILNEFLRGDTASAAVAATIDQLEDDPRLEEESPQENTLIQQTSPPQKIADDVDVKPVFRGAVATAIAQPGFEHPMFVPHQWQMPPDEQLWTMKLSMLTSISCMTLLLIVGVWTGVRRSRRRAVMDDNQFRWAEAVEYMDAFPYDH